MKIKQAFQQTLARPFSCSGIGLHSGETVRLSAEAAPPHTGIVFKRADLPHSPQVPAHFSSVVGTFMCTTLGLQSHPSVTIATVEHIMAAFADRGITNACVHVEGPEVPFMDGSAAPFIDQIDSAGIIPQDASCPVIEILKEVHVSDPNNPHHRFVKLEPSPHFTAHMTFDFGGRQGMGLYSFFFDSAQDNFKDAIAPARSFGFYEDAEKLHEKKLALGASLENTVVLDQGNVITPGGLRFEDEYVRHKILDAFGDLYLAGAFIQGAYTGYNSGHQLHHQLLEAVFDDLHAWQFDQNRSHA